MATIAEVLALAGKHWAGRPGEKTLTIQAGRCAGLLGGDREAGSLGPSDGIELLAALRQSGLSAKSVQDYYGAFKRAMRLGGGPDTATWPNAPTPPRKTRDPIKADDLGALIGWFKEQDFLTTADLAVFLRGTGMRVRVEGLSPKRWRVEHAGDDFDILHVTGKGSHERLIPVVDAEARELLQDMGRLRAMANVPYSTHLKRWGRGLKALGITSRKATPHSVRHAYATSALSKSSGNLTLVQELLGHADPSTTARYLHVDMNAKAKAVS